MDGSQRLAGFRAKFRVDELLVASTPAWSWSVRPGQATLGCGVLSLNRHAAQFSEVTAAEMSDLSGLLGKLERAVQSAFGNDRINYLMLMMVDPDVHFHVIPRYAQPKPFAGMEFIDAGWPAMPNLGQINTTDAAINQHIMNHLQSCWS